MDKLSIAFCDDEPQFRSLLRAAAETALSRHGLSAECAEAGSADELADLLGRVGFDLIFLDIDMPSLDGICFGERLRARGCRSDIIFVSNMEDRVYDIFRVHPWAFIRKSRCAAELPAVMEDYVRSRRDAAASLLLPGEAGRTLSVDPLALLYVEAVGKTQKLVSSGSEPPAVIRGTMRELEGMLLPYGFIRTHKGFLVNYRCIRRITSRSVLLDTGETLPVGRDRLNSAREQYLSLMKWKGLAGGAPV